jgi:hypothetical protein
VLALSKNSKTCLASGSSLIGRQFTNETKIEGLDPAAAGAEQKLQDLSGHGPYYSLNNQPMILGFRV